MKGGRRGRGSGAHEPQQPEGPCAAALCSAAPSGPHGLSVGPGGAGRVSSHRPRTDARVTCEPLPPHSQPVGGWGRELEWAETDLQTPSRPAPPETQGLTQQRPPPPPTLDQRGGKPPLRGTADTSRTHSLGEDVGLRASFQKSRRWLVTTPRVLAPLLTEENFRDNRA